MKRHIPQFAAILLVVFSACNPKNESKENIETADSINEAKREDTTGQGIASDEASTRFLVRAKEGGNAEIMMSRMAAERASIDEIKKIAQWLGQEHEQLQQQVIQLASARNITLPAMDTGAHTPAMDNLRTKTGRNFDKAYIDELISHHNASIDLFEDAIKDVKDNDVRMLADNALPKLRKHLDTAKSLQKKYW